MSDHHFTSTLRWQRTSVDFAYDHYNRGHEVVSGSGVTLPSSATTAFKGDADRINPEEMLLAALSSCHMLTFLAIASKKRFVVDAYDDDASAVMEKNANGKLAVTTATLRPRVRFSGEKQPTAEELEHMHHVAHGECFIANSVLTRVEVLGSEAAAIKP